MKGMFVAHLCIQRCPSDIYDYQNRYALAFLWKGASQASGIGEDREDSARAVREGNFINFIVVQILPHGLFSKALSTTHLRVQNQFHPSFKHTRSTLLNFWSKTFLHTRPLMSFSSGEHIQSWRGPDLKVTFQQTQAKCSSCPESGSSSILLSSRLPFDGISDCGRSREVLVSYSYSNESFILLISRNYKMKLQDQRRRIYDLTTSHRLEVRDRFFRRSISAGHAFESFTSHLSPCSCRLSSLPFATHRYSCIWPCRYLGHLLYRQPSSSN